MDKSEGKKIFSKTIDTITEKVAKAYYKFEKGVSISTLKKQKKEKVIQLGFKLIELMDKGEAVSSDVFKEEHDCIKKLESDIHKMKEERDNFHYHSKKSKHHSGHGHKHGHNYDVSSLSKDGECACAEGKSEETSTCCSDTGHHGKHESSCCSSVEHKEGEDVKCCSSSSKDEAENSDKICSEESPKNISQHSGNDDFASDEEESENKDK